MASRLARIPCEPFSRRFELGLRQAVKDEATCNFPQRDEQFEHIARLRKTFQAEGCPVLSIDTKKKELLGNFFRQAGPTPTARSMCSTMTSPRTAMAGWCPMASTMSPQRGIDVAVGRAGHQPLACDAIWRWWQRLGKWHYAGAKRLLLLCDCGGSNGYRQHVFKEELSILAEDLGMSIRVAHYPPGCSKYNPIEHRMFCHVTRALRVWC